MAHNTSLEELQHRVSTDPFVAANAVTAEIVELSPKVADLHLNFLVSEE